MEREAQQRPGGDDEHRRTTIAILEEATKQGILQAATVAGAAAGFTAGAAAFPPAKLGPFLGCVLLGLLTKPLPKAVADCAHLLTKKK